MVLVFEATLYLFLNYNTVFVSDAGSQNLRSGVRYFRVEKLPDKHASIRQRDSPELFALGEAAASVQAGTWLR